MTDESNVMRNWQAASMRSTLLAPEVFPLRRWIRDRARSDRGPGSLLSTSVVGRDIDHARDDNPGWLPGAANTGPFPSRPVEGSRLGTSGLALGALSEEIDMAFILGAIYFVLLITLGIISIRKGHWVMFIIGLFIPLFWIIGAVMPSRDRLAR